ncbi:MAG: ferric reductase-like transmembrane domain-containing protein [Solirubrobacteraceae bacterium]
MSRPPLDYGWWLASRASGIVALVLVTASVLIGLLMASGLLKRPGLKRSLVSFHEHTALVALVLIAVHGITLLGDRTLNPGPVGILLPFAMSYRPSYTALGILSGYLLAALGLTFYVRKRIGGKRWRQMHRATVVAYVLGVAHAIGAGSDSSIPAVRFGMVASALPAAALFLIRNRTRTRGSAARAARAQAAVAGVGGDGGGDGGEPARVSPATPPRLSRQAAAG